MTSRSDLLKLLTEACELEHGLACSYLYAAMSLKQTPDAERLPPDKMALVRQWAAQVYFVASQEMMHLAQAWNLLTALGGTPYYQRPNFPQGTRYYPLHLRLALEPYNDATLARFVAYESPEQPRSEVSGAASTDGTPFRTIGELYALIDEGIARLPQAIIGDPAAQVGSDKVDFPEIVKVIDRDAARRAIELVTHQGEGNRIDREDCHLGIFRKLRAALAVEREANPRFEPANVTVSNPTTDASVVYAAAGATLILDADANAVARLFDGLYSLMLRMLGYGFTAGGDEVLQRALGQAAIVLMVTVIKPLGEMLTRMPAAPHDSGRMAGPAFGLTRHVMLPASAAATLQVVAERLSELTVMASTLRDRRRIPGLERIVGCLDRVGASLENVQPPVALGSRQTRSNGSLQA